MRPYRLLECKTARNETKSKDVRALCMFLDRHSLDLLHESGWTLSTIHLDDLPSCLLEEGGKMAYRSLLRVQQEEHLYQVGQRL